MNAKALKRSIENETFTRINDEIWESEHWLRLSTRFFPKNLIVDMGFSIPLNKRCIGADVFLLYGETYLVSALIEEREDKEHQISQKVLEVLPARKIKKAMSQEGSRLVFSQCSISKKEFKEYVKNHTVEEILRSTELLERVVKRYMQKHR